MTDGFSRSPLRVRYAETDQMGIAYHGAYFVWFEVARVDYMRVQGVTYRDLEEKEGLRLPVIEAQAKFSKPSYYDDLLEVRARVAEVTGARISFEYAVHREGEAAPLATGRTSHAVVDKSGRAQRIPDDLKRLLS